MSIPAHPQNRIGITQTGNPALDTTIQELLARWQAEDPEKFAACQPNFATNGGRRDLSRPRRRRNPYPT